jgi:hypothetical protein
MVLRRYLRILLGTGVNGRLLSLGITTDRFADNFDQQKFRAVG